MRRLALALVLIPLLAGCQQSAVPGKAVPDASASASAAPPAPPAPPVPPVPTAARKVSEKTDLYEFDYSYPAAAAAIPALRDWLEADLARTKAGLASDAKDAKKDAKAEGFPFNPYTASSEWQVVTDIPGWLSLTTLVGSYTGGAHPNYGFDTILWDRAANNGAGQKRTATDLFTSKAALKAAVFKGFCAQLQAQRAKKREGIELGDPGDDFNKCIDPTEQTVILGSKSRKGFDRIGFLISPYAAGPYAEGSYEVTLPITAAVLGAVKPEYKAAFVVP